MPLIERGVTALQKTATVSGVALSWLLAAVSYPNWAAYGATEYLPSLAAVVYTHYLLWQTLLWTGDKPITVSIVQLTHGPASMFRCCFARY